MADVISLDQQRSDKEKQISELEAWESLINLSENEMMIISNVDGKLRMAIVKATRFGIKPEEL